MAVKKVFLGYPETEMFTFIYPDSKELFIHLNDSFDSKLCCNIKLDFKTAIAFRDELNRMIDELENNQL